MYIYIYIYTIVRYMGDFLTPRVAEYGMYGYGRGLYTYLHGCTGMGCIQGLGYVHTYTDT